MNKISLPVNDTFDNIFTFTNIWFNFENSFLNLKEKEKRVIYLYGDNVFKEEYESFDTEFRVSYFRKIFYKLNEIINKKNTIILFEIEIDNIYKTELDSNIFENNHLFKSYKDFELFATKNKLTESEFWAIILNIKNLYTNYTQKHAHNKSTKNQTSDEILNIEKYEAENPYQEDIKAVLENNYANGKIIKTLYFKNQILESLFTDFQAFHICKGLKNQSYLHNKYQNNKQTEEDTFLAHSLANTLLKEEGKKMVDFVLSLPSLPFKSEQFQILFSKLDKIRLEGKNENPIIRLKIPNEKGTEDEIEFSFYAIDGKKYINQIITKTKKSEVFSVTRNGTILPNENNLSNGKNLNITPILQLFYHISKSNENFNQAVISYGIESGKCSVCGRKLNDEKSKLKGIGPVCDKIL